ncbi:MAG: hypothetical protein LC769_09880 [Chloroflexi bacterium]|nr:hypothetical protein [Chloroflexota bacterium]
MVRPTYVTAEEARRLRGATGATDIAGYQDLLRNMDDGMALRVAMGGLDAWTVEEANFEQATRGLGIEVAFSQLREDDNIPYLLVTRNPNTLTPHVALGLPDA